MNVITKEYVYDLLETKLKVTDDEEIYLVKLIEELYDINNNIVIPLDEEETLVFRKHFGILDNGIPQSKEMICKEYNIGYQKYPHIINKILAKLVFRIKNIDKQEKIEKINSLNTNDEEILNKPIFLFPLDKQLKNKLMKSYILRFKDLMELSINELKNILGPKDLDAITSYVHSLNYKFINELSDTEKKEIFDNNELDIIGNSSPYFVDGVDKYTYNYLLMNNINDVRSLVKNVFTFPTKDRIEMMIFISKNNLSGLGREEESKKF